MDKPRVKPLVWRVDDSRTAYAQTSYFVDRYCIEHRLHGDDQFDLWVGPDAVRATRFPTLETAKAAAQADYEARILAAIDPAPVSVREAARVLLGHTPKITAKPLAEMSEAMKIDAHPAILLRGFCAALRAIAEGKDDD